MPTSQDTIHPLHGNNTTTIIFFLKVAVLTMIFAILRTILFAPELGPIHDHTPHTNETPGQKSTWTNISSGEGDAASILAEIVQSSRIPEPVAAQEHNAPYFADAQYRLDQICTEYSNICSITTRDPGYSKNEQLIYQAILVFMMEALNDYLDTRIECEIDFVKFYKSTDMNSRRGSATTKYVKINTARIATPEEFWQVLTHELGHTIDFTVITGYARQKNTTYTEFGHAKWPIDDPSIDYYRISRINESTRRSSAGFTDFVSGYGMRGMYEDLAEFNNMRLNHHSYLRTLVRNNPVLEEKYDFFADLYGRKYFSDSYPLRNYPQANERVRDSTQILQH